MGVVVVGSEQREQPGWDGDIHPVVGVVDPFGRAALSVARQYVAGARALAARVSSVEELREALPVHLSLDASWVYRATYRWSTSPSSVEVSPDVGIWVPADDERLPTWLHPFGGKVLAAFDGEAASGHYLAGVGLKRHDRYVHEIAVGTAETARGRGLARRLVAQAARELLASGVIPTYLHDPANVPSARVADAAGFPDQGWTVLGLSQR